MRGIQFSDFVEVFNCLMLVVMLVVMSARTVGLLKVPFEKAVPPSCPSDVPAPLAAQCA